MTYSLDDFVAPHLRMRDLACRCDDPDCGYKSLDNPYHARSLVFFRRVGELIREYPGYVKVNSALRCPVHNAVIGGAPNSAHIHRCAIDLEPDTPVQRLFHLAESANFFSGILLYEDLNMLHLDVHPDDMVRRSVWGSKHVNKVGRRSGSGLDILFEWNGDEMAKPPDYVRREQEREMP